MQWIPLLVVGVGCLIIALTFKIPGLLAAGLIMAVALWVFSRQPDSTERASLIDSIYLAAEDLAAITDAYDEFLHSDSTDALADRMLQRPALADPHTDDPDIQNFQMLYKANKRFLARLDTRIGTIRSNRGLEKLLAITDERCVTLGAAWAAAYEAARKER